MSISPRVQRAKTFLCSFSPCLICRNYFSRFSPKIARQIPKPPNPPITVILTTSMAEWEGPLLAFASPSFTPAKNQRVPHPSRPLRRVGWKISLSQLSQLHLPLPLLYVVILSAAKDPCICLCLTLIHTGHESAGAPSFAPLRRVGCKISLSQQLLLPLFSRHLERSEGPPHFALVPALAE